MEKYLDLLSAMLADQNNEVSLIKKIIAEKERLTYTVNQHNRNKRLDAAQKRAKFIQGLIDRSEDFEIEKFFNDEVQKHKAQIEHLNEWIKFNRCEGYSIKNFQQKKIIEKNKIIRIYNVL